MRSVPGRDEGEGHMGRNALVRSILLTVSAIAIAVRADDALQETPRAEALAQSSRLLLARNTGKTGSLRERQREGYWCSFRFEVWSLDSAVRGPSPWKKGDEIRVFPAGQAQDCWRANEYRSTGLDVGLMLPTYVSATRLADAGAAGARGVLLGNLERKRDLLLVVAGSIESPDQAESLGREWDREHATTAPPLP